jgi:hypothetical protein
MTRLTGSLDAARRKLRALSAMAEDPGASKQERATAQALKARVQRRLNEAGAPAGDWTDYAFRLGNWTKNIGRPASPGPTTEGWTDTAGEAGRALRRSYKRWLSD